MEHLLIWNKTRSFCFSCKIQRNHIKKNKIKKLRQIKNCSFVSKIELFVWPKIVTFYTKVRKTLLIVSFCRLFLFVSFWLLECLFVLFLCIFFKQIMDCRRQKRYLYDAIIYMILFISFLSHLDERLFLQTSLHLCTRWVIHRQWLDKNGSSLVFDPCI